MADSTPKIEEPKSEEKTEIDPLKKSDQDLLARYPAGLKPKLKSVAQRKISSGGMQYFDSGDYNAASHKEKSSIARNPNVPVVRPPLNPALSRLREGKPSKLSGGPPASGLAATSMAKSEQ